MSGLYSTPNALAFVQFAMNARHPILRSVRVRQAVNHSVDAQAIMKYIFENNGDVLNGPLNHNMIGYDPALKRYAYDPKRARQLLAQAGYADGIAVKQPAELTARLVEESGRRAVLVPGDVADAAHCRRIVGVVGVR